MIASRRTWLGLAVFLAGALAGVAATCTWLSLASTPTVEATAYVPLVDNDGLRFRDDVWESALQRLTTEFGGATLGPEYEGWWHDSAGKLRREPVRVVVVSFARDRLPAFRDALREVGSRLGQEAVYFRLEDVHVETLPVGSEKVQQRP